MKKGLKTIVLSIIYTLALPFGGSAKLVYTIFNSSLLFNLFAQLFSLFPGLPGSYLRSCFYQQSLKKSHLDVQYSFGSVVTKIMASVGHRAYIGMYTSIGSVEIGDDTVLANYVSVLSGRHQHNFDDPSRPIMNDDDVFSKITIGANCFLGEKVSVMADIGDNTIIGAGAVVVRAIPDYVVAVGNPAKVVKERTRPADTN